MLIRRRRARIAATAVLAAIAGLLLPKAHAQTEKTAVPQVQVRIDWKNTVGSPGYFRVGKDDGGCWWFLTPEGSPFFFRGVTSVSQDGWGTKRADGSSYDQLIKSTIGEAAFSQQATDRLQSWGFNALGAWSGPDLWDKTLPYTIICDFSKSDKTPQIDGTFLPDVFDPVWEKQIDTIAETLCKPHQNSKLLVGYFTDNELGWAQVRSENKPLVFDPSEHTLRDKSEPSLLQLCLSLGPERPAHRAAWAWLKARHKTDVRNIGSAWNVADLNSETRVAEWTKVGKALRSPGYVADDEAWSHDFAARYFRLTARAIHRYDAHHLILGCRFGAPPGPAVLAAVRRPDVDVVSANNYRDNFYERMDVYARGTGLPVLNTEFAWVSDYFTKTKSADGTAGASPTSVVLDRGRAALERAISHPQLVGYTWYRWVDKASFVPPMSYGLVSVQNNPNQTNLSVLQTVHARAEAIHAGIAPPFGAPPLAAQTTNVR